MNNGFDFTIAVCPNNINLNVEMEYIKSALLYADKIEIISPMAYLYFQLTDEKNQMNEKAVLGLINKIMPLCKLSDPMASKQFESIIKEFENTIFDKRYKTIPLVQRIQIKNSLKKIAIEINEVLKQSIGKKDCEEIELLEKNKTIVIQKFDHSLGDADGCSKEFFNKLKTSISGTYPIFDKQSNDLINAAMKSGIINLTKNDKYKSIHGGMAEKTLRRLPSIEYASVDEILDIRKELSDPLIRFRSKMLKYTETIQELPWDESFESECCIMYDKEIAPSILEIKELTSENSFLKNLGRNLFSDESSIKNTAGLVANIAVAGRLSSFSETISLNTAVLGGSTAWAASKTASSYFNYKSEKKEIGKKDLYFYYETGRRMSLK